MRAEHATAEVEVRYALDARPISGQGAKGPWKRRRPTIATAPHPCLRASRKRPARRNVRTSYSKKI